MPPLPDILERSSSFFLFFFILANLKTNLLEHLTMSVIFIKSPPSAPMRSEMRCIFVCCSLMMMKWLND
uniref:Uncharacterized protein n=1 Tax=Lepeophtheirus salmonis TaxID=72036 RepID=A0A0K2TAZ8_LEPSM